MAIKRGRPAKKKTESVSIEPIDSELIEFETRSETESVKGKEYFKIKLEELAEEMRIAIRDDRSLSIRLKSIYNNVLRDSTKL